MRLQGRVRAVIAVVSMVCLMAAAPMKVLRFGENPVDPTRVEFLSGGECIIRTVGLQGPVTVAAVLGNGERARDTGMVPNGTEVVVGRDGLARYIVACGNDVIGAWRPEGNSVRCGRDEVISHDGEPECSESACPEVTNTFTKEIEIRYLPAPTPHESFARRHPVWTGFMIGTGVALVTAVMCHNEVLGVCGDNDGHGTKHSADPNVPEDNDDDDNPPPPPPPCSNGDCDDPCLSNNGCDDDDDN